MVLFPSVFDGLLRTVSIKKGRNDQNIGQEKAEALAKEAKKNGSISCSSSTVKSHKSDNYLSFWSKKGKKGINQDSFIVWEDYGSQEDMVFCGVFDGHGPWGHLVSKQVRKSMPACMLCNWQETIASTPPDLGFAIEENASLLPFSTWEQTYVKTYATIDQELKQNSHIDSFYSGTTALTIVKQGQHLVIGNVGDSRAVLGTTSKDGSLKALQLTTDHKPNYLEAERIKMSNGRVFCLPDEPGVYRVWGPHSETPGLAISRALGDYSMKEFGLISVPDVTQRSITSIDQFVILASDGVWDVISNQEAVEIVGSAPNRETSAKRLVDFASLVWKCKKEGLARDDMSAICLFFHTSSPQPQ